MADLYSKQAGGMPEGLESQVHVLHICLCVECADSQMYLDPSLRF